MLTKAERSSWSAASSRGRAAANSFRSLGGLARGRVGPRVALRGARALARGHPATVGLLREAPRDARGSRGRRLPARRRRTGGGPAHALLHDEDLERSVLEGCDAPSPGSGAAPERLPRGAVVACAGLVVVTVAIGLGAEWTFTASREAAAQLREPAAYLERSGARRVNGSRLASRARLRVGRRARRVSRSRISPRASRSASQSSRWRAASLARAATSRAGARRSGSRASSRGRCWSRASASRLDVLRPNRRARPGSWSRCRSTCATEVEITLLANLVSLTPGTLVLDVSPDRDRFLFTSCSSTTSKRAPRDREGFSGACGNCCA